LDSGNCGYKNMMKAAKLLLGMIFENVVAANARRNKNNRIRIPELPDRYRLLKAFGFATRQSKGLILVKSKNLRK
jgi:hypothetical protein